jgi:hypothetical protein
MLEIERLLFVDEVDDDYKPGFCANVELLLVDYDLSDSSVEFIDKCWCELHGVL